ncbi:MAG: helix-turn-helix domain-containing protein [Desulfobulbus sp.]|jgi:transcriptional regulator with XRE-family HTH domain|uniref:helix-turn-helix domain-containing protein n=1 Tax=Desulfobulbus sp. TaxID=895 RepID=UPI00284FBE6E|nr:helix-turn-helix transcriptional regulator [Desulfobulbus sp.]MDR2551330.1 helix-turn-helix domain-containing protein [Desulfobulbus sp.]
MSTEKYRPSDNGIGERLLFYRKMLQKSGVEFSNIIGISQGSLSDIERGKTKPSVKALIGLIQRTDIDIRWLLTGEEPKRQADLIDHFSFYEELEQWARETGRSENTQWMRNQIESFFPMFTEWKKRRAEGDEDTPRHPASKIA